MFRFIKDIVNRFKRIKEKKLCGDLELENCAQYRTGLFQVQPIYEEYYYNVYICQRCRNVCESNVKCCDKCEYEDVKREDVCRSCLDVSYCKTCGYKTVNLDKDDCPICGTTLIKETWLIPVDHYGFPIPYLNECTKRKVEPDNRFIEEFYLSRQAYDELFNKKSS